MNTRASHRSAATRFTPLWVILGLWGGLVLLFAIQTKVTTPATWSNVLAQVGSFWTPWIGFLPLVVWASLRFPFERPEIWRHVGIHAAACAAVVLLNQLICRALLPLAPAPFDAHGPPPAQFRIGPDVLIYLVTMSASVAFAHFQHAQERERRAIELEARLAQAKLQALRMQINPHFLFNTLNAISTLVHSNPAVADDMITDLAELFRGSLESSDEQEIPLARELELLGRYLAIEQRRFGQRLQVELNIAPDISTALVPTLILQPVVENAIRHGIEPQKTVGRIAVVGRRDGDKVVLAVSDNGAKPVNVSVLANQPPQGGIGLANARARLQQLYGLDGTLAVANGELGGWTVEIKLPLRLAATKRA